MKRKVEVHNDVCEKCDEVGELLLCDGCNLSFHLECLGLHKVPAGKWFCEQCKLDALPRQTLPSLTQPKQFVDLLRSSQRILVFTGAGISVSAGIPDFRSKDGLYSKILESCDVDFDPQLVFDFQHFQQRYNGCDHRL
jgi:hypothetical protein